MTRDEGVKSRHDIFNGSFVKKLSNGLVNQMMGLMIVRFCIHSILCVYESSMILLGVTPLLRFLLLPIILSDSSFFCSLKTNKNNGAENEN